MFTSGWRPHLKNVTCLSSLPPTATGNELFLFWICLGIPSFISLSNSSLLDIFSSKIWSKLLSCHVKCWLPVSIRGSKTCCVPSRQLSRTAFKRCGFEFQHACAKAHSAFHLFGVGKMSAKITMGKVCVKRNWRGDNYNSKNDKSHWIERDPEISVVFFNNLHQSNAKLKDALFIHGCV